ncbi:S-methyl-5'-thioadenosine phosphorylase [Gordonia sp. NPDC003425]
MSATPARAALMVVGACGIGYGVFLTVTAVARTDWSSMVGWLAGGVIAHDAVLAPIWLAVWWILRRTLRDRGRYVPVAIALAFTGVLTLLAVPVLAPRPAGQAPASNPTLLDRNYPAGLAVAVAAVWAITGIWLVLHRIRTRGQAPPGVNPLPAVVNPTSDHRGEIISDREVSESDTGAIGIIGGTGFYDFFHTDVSTVDIETPFGTPSAPPVVGTVDGRRVVFIPRHGNHHDHLPHEIPYRANLWALRSLGVTTVIAAAAVGSLDPDAGPGSLIVPDQLIDRTAGRAATFFDRSSVGDHPHDPVHLSFADPYCDRIRSALCDSDAAITDGGTLMIIDGPRFSTRAESRMYAAWGADLINMTGQPEASLARELGMCYGTLCLVTDLDAGVAPGDGVGASEVFAQFAANLPRLKACVKAAISGIDPDAQCECSTTDHDIETLSAHILAHRRQQDGPAVRGGISR